MFSANTSQVSEDRLYVEDVFSTYLYTGNGSSQTITNGIDLAGKGGLVWIKNRGNNGTQSHILCDTARGISRAINTNRTNAEDYFVGGYVTSFNSSGYGIDGTSAGYNASGNNYASWTFREAPKFFDVVTYTGNGTAGRTVAHSLGVAPGTIIVKRTDAANGWPVYHRSMDATPQNYQMRLNATDGKFTTSPVSRWNNTAPTATEFTLSDNDEVNGSGATYVAYLFAHDTTSDGIIQCGSFTTGGSPVSVNLGWEPQWLLFKQTSTADDWQISDDMRGLPASSANVVLRPNTTGVEGTNGNFININSTGFVANNAVYSIGTSFIYIAIRRGPMRTPTSGTSVFFPTTYTGHALGDTVTVTTGFPVDSVWVGARNIAAGKSYVQDRLRIQNNTQNSNSLQTASTNSETAANGFVTFNLAMNTGYTINDTQGSFGGGGSTVPYSWSFRRAPSFFDEVCYTGTGGSALTLNHNLGVAPELVIFKMRSNTTSWVTLYSFTSTTEGVAYLNLTNAGNVDTYANHGYLTGAPTASQINLRASSSVGQIGQTYVAYLFASCPGVSKVGSYTGNGSSQTINCGFAAGARFVMIKRTDSTGDWYVWDSARGIVAGNDPRLSLNSTAAEVTTDDSVDTDSSGFVVNQLSATNINVSSATYIYLAVA